MKFRNVLMIFLVLIIVQFGAFASGGADEEAASVEVDGDYVPAKDITFVVPFSAGGNSDIPARIFAKYMTRYSDVEVKVTNIVGSGGKTGAKEVMKSDPDGSMIIMQPVGYPMQYGLGVADFTYEDFAPIGQWLDSTLAVVVNADSEFQTMDDLIKAARANPETLKMGSVTGTLPLFAIIEIEMQKDIVFHKVDLAGASKAPELLSGRIDGYIDGFGAVKQYIESDQFRCLGIISDVPIKGFESIPTFTEAGFSNYEYLKQAFGVWAPKNTPAVVVEYINNLIYQAANDQECIDELQALAYSPAHTTVEEYTKSMELTYAKFQEVAKKIIGE
ncbi:MAG: tripartite tricarboxylate transporter substrate binding protein [Bacteroidetes bacterium]|nr:tripartite tricarboxylate transporter substrate binding protein [Bacteroidota bacterium]